MHAPAQTNTRTRARFGHIVHSSLHPSRCSPSSASFLCLSLLQSLAASGLFACLFCNHLQLRCRSPVFSQHIPGVRYSRLRRVICCSLGFELPGHAKNDPDGSQHGPLRHGTSTAKRGDQTTCAACIRKEAFTTAAVLLMLDRLLQILAGEHDEEHGWCRPSWHGFQPDERPHEPRQHVALRIRHRASDSASNEIWDFGSCMHLLMSSILLCPWTSSQTF